MGTCECEYNMQLFLIQKLFSFRICWIWACKNHQSFFSFEVALLITLFVMNGKFRDPRTRKQLFLFHTSPANHTVHYNQHCNVNGLVL